MPRRATGNVVVNLRRKRPTVAGRFRVQGERVYVTFGLLEDWPPDRAWSHVRAIQRDIDAGELLPQIERRLARRLRNQRHSERDAEKAARELRQIKDPAGEALANIRRAAQMADRVINATESREERLRAREALTAIHSAEDAVAALVRARYDLG